MKNNAVVDENKMWVTFLTLQNNFCKKVIHILFENQNLFLIL